jgi:hypothetical protein
MGPEQLAELVRLMPFTQKRGGRKPVRQEIDLASSKGTMRECGYVCAQSGVAKPRGCRRQG